ncbi:hypothetical protein Rhe02_61500 [Rhizocola hellebori]|uniref:TIR domain-containing protein n=2 Tax=Rhizocola hellebori TaxID=1392758 RepID=A0A8J3VJK2_9ACTN|nr:hypothetical protein Rhe02_61500 [Rhizocola hellebori]
MLDASLTAAGVETFLDDRDIRIGDSFVERIYEGLAAATDLLYVVSTSSVNSAWVAEELGVAKVKQKQTDGFRILPVLVDDCDVPISVKHIRYADMRQWKDPLRYRAALGKLLASLDVKLVPIAGELTAWWLESGRKMRDARHVLNEYLGYLNFVIGWAQWFQDRSILNDGKLSTKPLDEDRYDMRINQAVEEIADLIEPLVAVDRRIAAFKEESMAFLAAPSSNWMEHDAIRKLRDPLRRALSLLDELEDEVTTVIHSTIQAATS